MSRHTDPAATLNRAHDRIIAALFAGDRAEVRRARRCYRRTLARISKVARWRHRNGF